MALSNCSQKIRQFKMLPSKAGISILGSLILTSPSPLSSLVEVFLPYLQRDDRHRFSNLRATALDQLAYLPVLPSPPRV